MFIQIMHINNDLNKFFISKIMQFIIFSKDIALIKKVIIILSISLFIFIILFFVFGNMVFYDKYYFKNFMIIFSVIN